MTTLTAQEELDLDFLLWDLQDFQSLGEFLSHEELGELEVNNYITFGEKFLGMKKVYPFKGVIVSKGFICLKEADE